MRRVKHARKVTAAAGALGLAAAGLGVSAFTSGRFGWGGLDAGSMLADAGAVWFWWTHRQPATPPAPKTSRHDRCLADIAQLERELAQDGVMFLMSPAEFDSYMAAAISPRMPAPPRNLTGDRPPAVRMRNGVPVDQSGPFPLGFSRWQDWQEFLRQLGQGPGGLNQGSNDGRWS